MATFQAVNILTGTVEGSKYDAGGDTTELWTVALPVTLSSADVILGPVIPSGVYLKDVVVDVDKLDTNGNPTSALECGYSGKPAAFIATANATPATGGVQHANVGGTVGYTSATPTVVRVTMTANGATKVAGAMRIAVTYTANP